MADFDQPKLAAHCASLYSRLEQAALTDKTTGDLIWRGKIIDAALSIGIPIGSYARVVNALRTLGCIDQIERGFRNRPSVYHLVYPPTPEVWAVHAPERTEDLTSAPSLDILAGQLEDVRQQLETQLGGLNIVEALRELERRIKNLEGQGLTASQTTAKNDKENN